MTSSAGRGDRRFSAPDVKTGVRLTYRLRLQASSLPRRKTGAFRRASVPDTYAVVTSISNDRSRPQVPAIMNSSSTTSLSPLRQRSGAAAAGYVWGKTEVIKKSMHPHWTRAIYMECEPDKQTLFYVHIFADNQEGDNEVSSTASSASTTGNNKNPVSAAGPVDYSNSLGAAVFDVSDILQTHHCTRVKRLRGGGLVFCRLERIEEEQTDLSQTFKFQLGARNLNLPNNRSNYRKVHTVVELSKFQSNGTWLTVHRSNVAQATGTASNAASSSASTVTNASAAAASSWGGPIWDPATVDLEQLCNGELEKPIRITVLQIRKSGLPGLSSDATTTSVIGVAETNLRFLLRMGLEANSLNTEDIQPNDDDVLGANELYLQRSLDKRKIVGRLCVISATTETTKSAEEESPDAAAVSWNNGYDGMKEEVVDLAKLQPVAPPTAPSTNATTITTAFQHYIDRGCGLEFSVAIDFTSSNGDPQFEDSLHYQSEHTLNDYEETIVAVGKAIDAYSKKQQYAVWGFGAKYGGTVRHLFQCGSQALVNGVDGILGAYKSVFHSDFIMSGPTILLNILQAAAVQSRKIHESMTLTSLSYNVLLIITDGLANELEETRRKLSLYSFLPLSVIIVGVGRSDFRLMYQLNNQPLSSSTAVTRTNTSFVEFRKHQHNPTALGQAALREVPAQLCQYMKSRGF